MYLAGYRSKERQCREEMANSNLLDILDGVNDCEVACGFRGNMGTGKEKLQDKHYSFNTPAICKTFSHVGNSLEL